jgi:hypothetical protein
VLEICIYFFNELRHDIEYATDRDGVRLVYMLFYTILAVQVVIIGTECLSPWHKEGGRAFGHFFASSSET